MDGGAVLIRLEKGVANLNCKRDGAQVTHFDLAPLINYEEKVD